MTTKHKGLNRFRLHDGIDLKSTEHQRDVWSVCVCVRARVCVCACTNECLTTPQHENTIGCQTMVFLRI